MTQPRMVSLRNDRNGRSILKIKWASDPAGKLSPIEAIWAKLKLTSILAPANYDLTDIDIPNIWHVGLNFDFCGVKPKSV